MADGCRRFAWLKSALTESSHVPGRSLESSPESARLVCAELPLTFARLPRAVPWGVRKGKRGDYRLAVGHSAACLEFCQPFSVGSPT